MKNVSILFLTLGMRVFHSVRHTVAHLPASHLKCRFQRSATNWEHAVGGGVNPEMRPKTIEYCTRCLYSVRVLVASLSRLQDAVDVAFPPTARTGFQHRWVDRRYIVERYLFSPS
ncbi:hypothetical protein OOU_Y34scaffold00275g3 [Pyricularia oryzae Y34]|uniref:Uncharacterized protein n=3 Tax=Pyricularia oryzae TaxID=318829 RepID=Q2KF54_PYRO7|nr:hypothetical protein MGCH7_ch7g832 [Pyricularia oryzae 70-15]ELQ41487.1 hypothetical protein OOU_Y34scaffold00275g3 [Pyricularia oryzae Y34]